MNEAVNIEPQETPVILGDFDPRGAHERDSKTNTIVRVNPFNIRQKKQMIIGIRIRKDPT